jgi:hypothetical protein
MAHEQHQPLPRRRFFDGEETSSTLPSTKRKSLLDPSFWYLAHYFADPKTLTGVERAGAGATGDAATVV